MAFNATFNNISVISKQEQLSVQTQTVINYTI
jgi:hypothetical protein